MCTLILLHRVVPGCPVAVAANRDEYHARPAAGPARFAPSAPGKPAIVAPQDLQAGGTWMGLNTEGLFVGLTNRASAAPRADRRSRGLLVRDALECGSARQVAETLGRGVEGRYNPFHLIYSDGRDAFLTHLGEDKAETARLEPGIHVVCNRGEEDPMTGKAGAIRRALGTLDLGRPFARVFGDLSGVLASHDYSPQPLENPCVHTPGYGTRSAAILASGGAEPGFWFASGPPCESKFEDFTDLLSQARQVGSAEG